MSGSPSELLTFYRRLATGSPAAAAATMKRARALPRRPQPARAITYTAATRSSDLGAGKKHATDKPERRDVQSDNSGAAQDAKLKGEGGHATSQKDSAQNAKRGKEEFPEAPDQIGFQDERGSKKW